MLVRWVVGEGHAGRRVKVLTGSIPVGGRGGGVQNTRRDPRTEGVLNPFRARLPHFLMDRCVRRDTTGPDQVLGGMQLPQSSLLVLFFEDWAVRGLPQKQSMVFKQRCWRIRMVMYSGTVHVDVGGVWWVGWEAGNFRFRAAEVCGCFWLERGGGELFLEAWEGFWKRSLQNHDLSVF